MEAFCFRGDRKLILGALRCCAAPILVRSALSSMVYGLYSIRGKPDQSTRSPAQNQ
jgi:hypothetical protein